MKKEFENIKAAVRSNVPHSFWCFLHTVACKIRNSWKRINGLKLLALWQLSPTKAIALCSYQNLITVQAFLDPVKYQELTKLLFEKNIKHIYTKSTIKIWFMFFLDSIWACDYLYQLFEMSEKFEPIVVLMDILDEATNERNRRFVEEKQYRYITSQNIVNASDEPDIVMYPTLYNQNVKGINIGDRNLSSLIFCIPYTFWWVKGTDSSMLDSYNASVLWRFYAPTRIHMQMGILRNINGKQIMRYSGYPKIDTLAHWKSSNKEDGRKTIIYAPGMWSSEVDNNFCTFDINAIGILQLAKKTEHRIKWIYRPHPQLGVSLEKCGVMELKDYQAYEEAWSEIANALISIGGSYHDIFLSSDAMITDAISFVSTYQYVKKPLLFIDRYCGPVLNEFGQKLHDVVYHADAKDINKIKQFIEDVVLGKNDILKEKRERFFREHLDYYSENHCTASEYIYNDICKAIFGEKYTEEIQ